MEDPLFRAPLQVMVNECVSSPIHTGNMQSSGPAENTGTVPIERNPSALCKVLWSRYVVAVGDFQKKKEKKEAASSSSN